jgi:hypothetical protein
MKFRLLSIVVENIREKYAIQVSSYSVIHPQLKSWVVIQKYSGLHKKIPSQFSFL